MVASEARDLQAVIRIPRWMKPSSSLPFATILGQDGIHGWRIPSCADGVFRWFHSSPNSP